MRRLCVFCGSSAGHRPEYREAAHQLGRLLAEHGIGLVFGGGHIGLMGILADAILEGDGEAIGVIPQALVDRELAHNSLTTLHVVNTMHQRKALMADLADGFVGLPGGVGTADEFFEILTWAQLGMHAKPVGLLNVVGFFDPLLQWLDTCVREGFLAQEYRELLRIAAAPRDLLEMIMRHHPAPQTSKWIDAADR